MESRISNKRIVWVDIAKGLSILMMVISHEMPTNSFYYALIFSFHMPLFFILSGYTSREVRSLSKLWTKVKKLLKNIWLLAVIMIFLLSLESSIFFNRFNILMQTLKGIYWGSNSPLHQVTNVGVMWFLFVFVWSKVLFNFLQVFAKKNTVIGFILFILTIVSYIFFRYPTHWLPQALDIVPFAALFMWSGEVFKRFDIQHKKRIIKITVFIIAFIVWIVCVANRMFIDMSVRNYPHFLLSIFEAVAGTFIVCLLSNVLSSCKPFIFLEKIGQHTLAIMCIHHLDLYWVVWDRYFTNWWLALLVRLSVDMIIFVLYLYMIKLIQLQRLTWHSKEKI